MPNEPFTLLPGYANSPGAFTERLTDNENAPLNAYFRVAELDFRRRAQKRLEDQQEIENRLRSFNFDTSGAWEVDLPEINEDIKGLIQYAHDNPEALTPTGENLDGYLEFQRRANEIRYKANKSKLDRAKYYENVNLIQKNPDEYADPEFQQTLEGFKSAGVDRGDLMLPPPSPKVNVLADAPIIEKELTTGKKSKSISYKDQLGQIVNDVTETQVIDLEKLPQVAKSLYTTKPSYTRLANEIYNELTPAQKQQYGNDPSQVLVDVFLPHITAQETEKTTFRTDWMSQFAAKEEAKGSQDAWIVDFGVNLHTPGSKAYTDANGNIQTKMVNGVEFDFAPAQADMYVKAPTKLFTNAEGEATSITNIGGFLRDKKTGKIYASPVGDPDKLFPIENYHTQVVSPSLGTKYKGSPAYNFEQDVQNYAPTGDPNDVLKIPRKKENQTTISTRTYSSKQESGIKAVMAANPGKTRDEIIKALQDAGKLPK